MMSYSLVAGRYKHFVDFTSSTRPKFWTLLSDHTLPQPGRTEYEFSASYIVQKNAVFLHMASCWLVEIYRRFGEPIYFRRWKNQFPPRKVGKFLPVYRAEHHSRTYNSIDVIGCLQKWSNDKVVPVQAVMVFGGIGVYIQAFLTSAVDGGQW
jgi:hypothetical protein